MKTRNQDYYASIVSKMGGSIWSTNEIYKLIEETDTEFGFKTPKNLLSCYTEKLCGLLGENISVVDDTTVKRRGRGGCSKLFQINDLSAAMAMLKNQQTLPVAEKAKVVVKTRGKRVVDLETLLRQLYKQLEVAYETNDFVIKLTPAEMKCLLQNHIESILFADWSRKKKNIISFGGQRDVKNNMLSLDSYMKEKFNVDLGACTKFNVVKVTTRERKALTKEDEDQILYVIGKLLCHEKRPIDIFAIIRTLREHLGISIDRQDLANLVKSEELLSVSQDKTTVGSKTNADMEIIFQKYSPKKHKERIFVRLGMTLEEVQ